MEPLDLATANISSYYAATTEALYRIGRAYYTLGKPARAQRLLSKAIDLLEASEEQPQDYLKLLLLYGQVLITDYLLNRGSGNSEHLFAIIKKARQLAEAANLEQDLAHSLGLLGQAYYFTAVTGGAVIDDPESGRYDAAFSCQQEALETRQALKDTRGISESLFQIGAIHERWQQYDRARQYYTEALKIADRYGHLFEKAEPTRHLAIQALLQGNLEEALSLALVALELRQVLHFKPYQPLDHLLLRDIYQAKGDHAKVELHEQKASRLAEELGYPLLVSSMPGIKARLSK